MMRDVLLALRRVRSVCQGPPAAVSRRGGAVWSWFSAPGVRRAGLGLFPGSPGASPHSYVEGVALDPQERKWRMALSCKESE